MSKSNNNGVGPLLEILADEATFGLGADQNDLLKAIPEDLTQRQRDEMMRVAGLTQLSFLKLDANACQDMPEHVREKILTKADDFFAQQSARETVAQAVNIDEFRPTDETDGHAARRRISSWAGWSIAAALLIAILLNETFIDDNAEAPIASISQQRIDFIENAPDAIQTPWQTIADFAGQTVVGDVVWSSSQQRGFLRLAGMPANDSKVSQYQLWIIDPTRDANPVDGGVFDVPADVEEAIIRIDAKLRISSPSAFAVTSEQPGGVVVSGGPLLIVATVES